METLVLPLFIVVCLQALVTALLLIPIKSVSLPVANYVCKLLRSDISKPVVRTISVLLLVLFFSGFPEILRGSKSGSPRVDLMGEVDHRRAQVTCLLNMMNLLLLLLNQALASEKRQLHLCNQNLEAMKRQVKGLQSEYERVTSSGDKAKASTPLDDAEAADYAALKKQVDKLIQEKMYMQGEVDAAAKGKASAEARAEALLSQIKGFDKEYDRVLDENKALKAKLEGAPGPGFLSGSSNIKKDE